MQTQSGTRLAMLDSFHYLYPIKINTIFIRFPGCFEGTVQILRNKFLKEIKLTETCFNKIFKSLRYVIFECPPKRNVRTGKGSVGSSGKSKQFISASTRDETWNGNSFDLSGVGGILKAFFLPPPLSRHRVSAVDLSRRLITICCHSWDLPFFENETMWNIVNKMSMKKWAKNQFRQPESIMQIESGRGRNLIMPNLTSPEEAK